MTPPADCWIHMVLDFSSEPGGGTGANGRNPQALPTLCSKDNCPWIDSWPPTVCSPTKAYYQVAKPSLLPLPSPTPSPTPLHKQRTREVEGGEIFGHCLRGNGSGILVGVSQQDRGRGQLVWVSNGRSWNPQWAVEYICLHKFKTPSRNEEGSIFNESFWHVHSICVDTQLPKTGMLCLTFYVQVYWDFNRLSLSLTPTFSSQSFNTDDFAGKKLFHWIKSH